MPLKNEAPHYCDASRVSIAAFVQLRHIRRAAG
jgi:hypothetical protein